MAIERRGLITILSSPSGAGKTTLTRMLLQDKALDLTLSVSVTTRARRSSEADGIHYHFIDARRFEAMRAAGELLEAADVHAHRYGTPRAPVEAVLSEGRDMLFDIDWQGAQQVRQALGADDRSRMLQKPKDLRHVLFTGRAFEQARIPGSAARANVLTGVRATIASTGYSSSTNSTLAAEYATI